MLSRLLAPILALTSGIALYLPLRLLHPAWLAPLVLTSSLVWALGMTRSPALWPSLGLPLMAGWAGLAAWRGLPPQTALVALILTLAAWDLDAFQRRWSAVHDTLHPWRLELLHFLYLGGMCGLGYGLAALSLGLRLRLTFGWILLLGLLFFLALSRLARPSIAEKHAGQGGAAR